MTRALNIKGLNLHQRTAFEIFVRAFIKKGYKEKAFKIALEILTRLKFQTDENPMKLLTAALDKSSCRFELRVNKFSKPPKKQKGRPKLRGRLFNVIGARVRRRAVKEILRNSLSRMEESAIDQIVQEIVDINDGVGVTVRKKREFYESVKGARATLEVVKRHRRRKRINRL